MRNGILLFEYEIADPRGMIILLLALSVILRFSIGVNLDSVVREIIVGLHKIQSLHGIQFVNRIRVPPKIQTLSEYSGLSITNKFESVHKSRKYLKFQFFPNL